MGEENSLWDFLLIQKYKNVTKITNSSYYNLIISTKPVKPKRKYYDMLLIKPGSYLIIEKELDMSKVSLSFELN